MSSARCAELHGLVSWSFCGYLTYLINSKLTYIAEVHFLTPPFSASENGEGYSYLVPDDMSIDSVGIRVRVPFGNHIRIGFVTRLHPLEGGLSVRSSPTQSGLKVRPPGSIKQILAPLDPTPLLSPDLIELTRWIADYYLCEWGEVIAAAVPTGLKPRRNVKYRLAQPALSDPVISDESSPAAELWRALKRQPLSSLQIQRRFPNGSALFGSFNRKGWLEAIEVEPKRKLGVYDTLWSWTGEISYEDATAKLPSNSTRLRCAVELLSQADGAITQPMLSKIESGLATAMRSLTKKGWVKAEQVPRDRRSMAQQGLEETASAPIQLSPLQLHLVHLVHCAIGEGAYKTFLLHGVTGSGKTLVYLEVIEAALKAGKSVIVMTPEISLTPQLTGRLYRRFGEQVIVTHSGLSTGERQDAWRMIRSGAVKVVVGPRSTLFAPVKNLGLVIVDEEHDDSYKQSDPAPRYNGRDAAIYRARLSDAVVLLGSATPSVTSYYNSERERWQLLELPERYGNVKLPDVRVVKWGIGDSAMFSPPLEQRLEATLAAGEQAIILVNRRAFANYISCPDCGQVASCPNCDISLRYHKIGQKIECHYCGYVERVYDLCPNCRGRRLRFSGIGTQRVEKELQRIFPQSRIARMDLDTTRTAGAHQEILSRFARKESDILLGTQMVAKGHDFPDVTLVGVLAADFEWIYPDFRSIERAFRLLVQAAGRTGRDGRGEVVIQSWNPAHPMLRWVQAHDYKPLYASEIASRQGLHYPPFGRLITVVVRGEHQDSVAAAADRLREVLLCRLCSSTVLGPATPSVERLDGQYRRKLLIKLPANVTESVRSDKSAIRKAVAQTMKHCRKSKVRVVVDVDPVET